MRKITFEPGQVFKVECPFIRTTFTDYDLLEADPTKDPVAIGWRPGVRWTGDGFHDDYPEAHGMGFVIYTVIDTHKLPKPYRARVFYLRSWIDPDGRAFGKKDIKMTTYQVLRHKIDKWKNRTYDVEIVDLTESDKQKLLEAA